MKRSIVILLDYISMVYCSILYDRFIYCIMCRKISKNPKLKNL